MMKLPVLIMAGSGGGEEPDALLEYANVKYKAMIKLGGKTILERMLNAIADSGVATRIYIVGIPEDELIIPDGVDKSKVVCLEIKDADVPTRLEKATEYVLEEAKTNPEIFPRGTFHGFFASGDIPFINGEMIIDFIEKCGDLSKDLYPAIVHEDDMLRRFPESKRTYGKLTEGKYCVGDVHVFDFSLVKDRIDRVKILRANRKNFAMTIFRLKPSIVFRFLIGRLGMKHLVNGTNKVFKLKSDFVITNYAELAMDVDKPHQLEIAKKEFES